MDVCTFESNGGLASKYPFSFFQTKLMGKLVHKAKAITLNATTNGYASLPPPFNLDEGPIHMGCDIDSDSTGTRQTDSQISSTLSQDRSGMQEIANTLRIHGRRVKLALLQHMSMKERFTWSYLFSNSSTPTIIPYRGLENTTVAELLKIKGGDEAGSLYWCRMDDTVLDAVKNMTQHNIGCLVVVKPGDRKLVAGIFTERDYLRKIIAQGRSSKDTKVGEIMTDENKLITVSSDTNILQAMELMTDKHIRHVPVVDQKVVGMISIVDVVRAVVEQQHEEVKRLNDYIKGDYY